MINNRLDCETAQLVADYLMASAQTDAEIAERAKVRLIDHLAPSGKPSCELFAVGWNCDFLTVATVFIFRDSRNISLALFPTKEVDLSITQSAHESAPTVSVEPDTRKKRLTRQEAAAYLRVSLVTIDRWLNDGTLKHYRLGRRVLFDRELHLDEFLRGREVQ